MAQKLAKACWTLLTLWALAALPTFAGTVSLAWDPVSDSDLAGYRIYYGTAPGSYPNQVDVGLTTSHMLTGLVDCTTWYLSVKAYDAADQESASFSNEVSGWPRPVVSGVSPDHAYAGSQVGVTVTGTNFMNGATVTFSDPAIQIDSITVQSCGQMVVNVTIGSGAAVGPVDVEVVNPDQVFGTAVGMFTIDPTPVPPAISSQPADAIVTEGQTASFSVTATGTLPLGYQWQRNGTNIAGATGATYTTPATTLADSGSTYRCVVSNAAGSATSNAATLTVLDGTPPVITQVQASGITETGAVITWSTDEPADGQVFYRRSGTSSYQQTALDPALATAHSQTLQGLLPGTTYEYRVQSADAAGNAADSSPDQTFTTTASNQPPTAAFTANPTSGDAPLAVSFDASGSSDPDGSIAAYAWDFDDGATATAVAPSHTYSTAGVYAATLTVTDDRGATDSTTTTIIVNEPPVPPTITSQPASQTVTEGQTATFTLTATGTPPLAYQWQKNGSNVGGATSASYTTPATTLADNGSTYRCVVTNTAGSVTSNPATLTVLDGTPPVISNVHSSNVAETTADITWSTDEPSDSQVLYRPSGTSTYQQTTLASALVTAHSVTLQALLSGTTYEYHVRSADAAGNAATSSPDRSFTTPSAQNQPPVAAFTANPTSGDAPLAVSFDASGSSDPDGSIVTYAWDFGDGSTGGGVNPSHSYASAGTYSAVLTVTDDRDAVDSTTDTITVSEPVVAPSITSEPDDAVVTEGMAATFTVTADGTPPLTYQWQKNGVEIAGATAPSYTTPPTAASDDGSTYRCVVDNAAGSTPSRAASLTVHPPGERVTDGLTLLYTFEEGQGTTVGDVSPDGTPLDLTITEPAKVHWVPSGLTVDSATVLDSGQAASELTAAVQATNEITLEAWLRPADASQGGPARILTFGNRGSSRNLSLMQDADVYEVRLRTTATNSSGQPGLPSPGGSLAPAMTHVLFTHDAAGNERLYVDGVERSSRAAGGDLSVWDPSHRLLLANELTANRPWLGSLYLVALYDRALSTAEIDQNFLAGPYAAAPAQPPAASFTFDPTWGEAPLAVSFDASGSTDPDGTIVSYDWDFGDGSTGSGVTASHTYGTPGTYTVVLTVTDGQGLQDSATGSLTVAPPTTPPSITTHPANQTVTEGQTATFSVTASGTPPLGYQWQRNGTNVAGANSPSYTTPPTTLADSGSTYRCVVTNTAGSATSNPATLTVLDGTAPVLSQVQASGVTQTAATITWSTNEPSTSRVAYRRSGTSTYQQTTLDPGLVTAHSVALQGLLTGTTYEYHVSSADAAGNSATSSPDGTFTTSPNQPPVAAFTANPTSGDAPLAVSFNASGSSDPDGSIASYAWNFGDGTTGAGVSVSHTYSAAGNYTATLTVTDDRGATDSATAGIVVTQAATAPAITSPPANQSVPEGSTATFSVSATGTPPLSYRWQKNNVDISGATSSTYTTPPVTLSDNGATYRCIVSNSAGSTASAPATLTVLDVTPPVISQVAASSVGSTDAVIQWTTNEPADGRVFYRRSGDSSYQQTSLAASLVTSHAVTLQNLSAGTTYEYHVRSADAAGNAATSTPDGTFTTSPGGQPPPTVSNVRRADIKTN